MGIPLAALAVSQPPSPLDQASKLVALQGGLQEQQLRAQELKQQQYQFGATQAMNKAYQGAVTVDENGQPKFDTDALTKSLSAQGYGSQVPEVLKHVTDFQQSQATLRKTNQDIADSQQKMQVAQTDMMGSVGAAIKAANYDPGLADTFLQHFEMNNPQSRAQVDQLRTQMQQNPAMVKQIADNLIASSPKQRELAAQEQTAQARAQSAQTSAAEFQSKLPGGMNENPEQKYIRLQSAQSQGQPLSQADQTWMAGYEKNKKMVPQMSAELRMQGMGAIRQFPVYDNQTKQTVYMDSNEINDAKLREPGRFSVPSYTPEAEIAKGTGTAFAPGGKAGQELKAFNTAFQHADLLTQAAQALDNGDVKAFNSAKNALKTQFGSADVTNFSTIADVYNHEVLKALGGHVTDAEVRQAGAMIPSNASPAQIKGALQNLKAMMQSKIGVLKQQYEAGKSGQPAFNGVASGGTPLAHPFFSQFGGQAKTQ